MRKVSVVIPTYNTGPYIKPTLESAVSLAGVEPEVIVVDDGSSDTTADIAEACPGVRVWRQENGGDSAARRKGFELSSGEFVIFLDHDDLLHPTAALAHLRELEADKNLDMVFGSNLIIDQEGAVIGQNMQERRYFSGMDVVRHVTPSFSQCMYRRSTIERIGGFRDQAGSCADIDLNMRLLGRREAGLCHGEVVMSYRHHANQQTRSPAKMYRQMFAVFEDLLGKDGHLEDPDLLKFARRYWGRYYGQFLPLEIARAVRQGKGGAAKQALGIFAGSFPHSAAGAFNLLRAKSGSARAR